jgi:hypothetical protein
MPVETAGIFDECTWDGRRRRGADQLAVPWRKMNKTDSFGLATVLWPSRAVGAGSRIAGILDGASPHRTMFDPLRQFFVAGSNVAHRLLSISVVHGFGSSQDLLSTCSQIPCERPGRSQHLYSR